MPATGRVRVTVTDEQNAAVPARIGVVGFDPSPEVRPRRHRPLLRSGRGPPVRLRVHRLHRLRRRRRVRPRARHLPAHRLTRRRVLVLLAADHRRRRRHAAGAGADRARRRHHRLHLLRLPRARHRQRRLARARHRPRQAVRRRGRRQHHHDRSPRPHRPDADHRRARLHAVRARDDRRRDHHLGLRPLQRLSAADRSRPAPAAARPTGRSPSRPGATSSRYGAFSATPAELEALAIDSPLSTPDTVVQINHIDSHFDPLRIDTALVPPQSFITPTDKLRYRLDPDSRQPLPSLQGARGVERRQPRQAGGVPRSAPRHLVQPPQPGI